MAVACYASVAFGASWISVITFRALIFVHRFSLLCGRHWFVVDDVDVLKLAVGEAGDELAAL